MIEMPKRCETINNGNPCPSLASDGTCLMPKEELREKCPARETIHNEQKDDWMDKGFYSLNVRSKMKNGEKI